MTEPVVWRLGTIGFAYPGWSGTFYPRGLDGPKRLTHYASRFNAIELDNTFYALPAKETVQRWTDAVPDDFRFSLKMPGEITHGTGSDGSGRKLTAPKLLMRPEARELALRFLDVASTFGKKHALTLLQFPAEFAADRRTELGDFLASIPVRGRCVVEFRHRSWWTPETAAMLRSLEVSWVAADQVTHHEAERAPSKDDPSSGPPAPIVVTTDVLYVRWIGRHDQFPDESYEQLNPSLRLEWWSQRLRSILERCPQIRTVYALFGNGFAGHAPATARRFAELAGLPIPPANPDTPLLFGGSR